MNSDTKSLPVLWHLALLSFAQRYRNDSKYPPSLPLLQKAHAISVTEDQREALLDLLLAGNEKIVPEIRRELLAGRGRGVPAEQEGPAFDGDDTMLVDA
jgi:essential nuclear protein 1